MTKQEAAELLETHRNWRKGLIEDYEFNTMFTLQEGDEAVDLAIEALRERPAPQAIEWKPGPPDKEGKYLIAIHSWYGKDVVEMYWFVRDDPMSTEKLKKVAFHAAWPQYPDRV